MNKLNTTMHRISEVPDDLDAEDELLMMPPLTWRDLAAAVVIVVVVAFVSHYYPWVWFTGWLGAFK